MLHHDEQIDLIVRWVNRWRELRRLQNYRDADVLRRFLTQIGVDVSTGGWLRDRVRVTWHIPLGIGSFWWIQ